MAKNFSTAMGKVVHETDYRIIYGDTDAAGIVYNANYLRLFEIGRTELMRHQGVPYSRIEELGCILPVTESYLRFKAPAMYDEIVTIGTSLVEFTDMTCRFHYAISKEVDKKTKVLVRGFTTLACVDKSGKLRCFPEEITQAVSPLLDDNQG